MKYQINCSDLSGLLNVLSFVDYKQYRQSKLMNEILPAFEFKKIVSELVKIYGIYNNPTPKLIITTTDNEEDEIINKFYNDFKSIYSKFKCAFNSYMFAKSIIDNTIRADLYKHVKKEHKLNETKENNKDKISLSLDFNLVKEYSKIKQRYEDYTLISENNFNVIKYIFKTIKVSEV